MARRKRTSAVLETARQRMAGLNSITPAPDFGPTLTVAAYQAEISVFTELLDRHNQRLSEVDESQNQVDDAETRLHDLNKRMLAAIGAHYGPDSSEYEQTGGTRLRDRKRPARKEPAKPTGESA